MACCGERRRPPVPGWTAHERLRPGEAARVAPPVQAGDSTYFEYIGPSGLTVFGPVTGRRYRFAGNGTVQAIDVHDAPSMVRIPSLRRLGGDR